MARITQEEMQRVMEEKLAGRGVPADIAQDCAALLVENSLDGIYSHGVNRFPRLLRYLDQGYVKPDNRPQCVLSLGALEQWDGNLGMGNTNARTCMDRAVQLAKQHGIGAVALRNTNHWMRGGSYGMQAALAGCAGICWTNTQPNMPAWGTTEPCIGNNPLVLCVPRGKDDFVLCDGAMAQFSYGAIEAARLAGRMLPVPGGFDTEGNETRDPAEIEKTWRVMPIGYWKGSAFSVLMDMMAAGLSAGNTVGDVGRLSGDEFGLSQVFIALDVARLNPDNGGAVERIIADIKAAQPADSNVDVLYPGEKELRTRRDNLENGIPVEDAVWQEIAAL